MTNRRRSIRVQLPRSDADPTGRDAAIRGAAGVFRSKLREIRRAYIAEVQRLPRVALRNATTYEYRLDPSRLSNLLADLGGIVDRIMLEGGAERLWLAQQYIIPSYNRGTQATHANLASQSVPYAELRQGIEALITSEAYRNRIGRLTSRVFEEMVGFTATTRASLARVLADGMALGQGPRQIAELLSEAIDVDYRRALRIARTEVNNAFRQARMDEADAAARDLGLTIVQMHFSARSPTTRPDHAARHGRTYTTAQQRAWWATGANSINCRCTTLEVILDERGQPLDPTVFERVKDRHPG